MSGLKWFEEEEELEKQGNYSDSSVTSLVLQVSQVTIVVCGQLYRVLASLVLELHWRRGGVGGMAPPLLEKFKMVVESWEKMLWGVT